jgi:NAD(P)-dependent dehydrogenase (short-subunit alcohol dehydrogenase family)
MSSRIGAYIVSGAGSGIGRAIAEEILRQGHHVFGLGRDPKKLEAVARAAGTAAFSFSSVDLSRAAETSQLSQQVQRWLAHAGLPLLGLVNNAGVFDRISFLESSDAIWQRQFENNMMSAVRLARDFHKDLKAGAPSSILNIASTLGLRPVAGVSAYSAIKAAMVNWTQSLAIEWAAEGIRVNCICPGIVDTPIHPFHAKAADHEDKAKMHSLQPLGRLGRPEDIAKTAWFLLSENSNWTTGAVLSVDGGIHL